MCKYRKGLAPNVLIFSVWDVEVFEANLGLFSSPQTVLCGSAGIC